MPGRRYTAPATTNKPKDKRKAQKRSLNALAIAEKQDPQKQRLRPNRLGKVEEISEKRKRVDDGSENSEDQEDGHRRSKRIKEVQKDRYGEDIEQGSDSEGNTWKLGAVDSDDDSDLDSDEALGESDEERFDGFVFRGSSTPKGKSSTRKGSAEHEKSEDTAYPIDLNEISNAHEDEDADDESDDFRENAIDLADVLDLSEDDDDEIIPDRSKRERIDSGQSSDSGSGTSDASEDDSSALSLSDADDDGNDTRKLSALQSLVSSMAPNAQNDTSRRLPDAQESITPSEYNLNPRQKLTVADLLPTITDPTLRRSLKVMADNGQKSGGKMSGIPQKLEVPLPKRQQDRLDRSVAYEKSKETLNRWIDTIKHNRRAEHLTFPVVDAAKEGNKFPTKLSATRTKPVTDLESTIHNILVESGLSTADGKTDGEHIQAFEELQTNKLPIEEVQARRAELRKARELLFREEIRAKRIKKIKSKSYRRVHRKERERIALRDSEALVAAGVELSEDEQERNDRRRAEERMGARHRESKWAKGVRQSGRAAWDEDARDGVTEMARRGEELRRRIEGKDVHDEDESLGSESSSEADDEEDSAEKDERNGMRLKDKLRRLQEGNPFLSEPGNSTNLASMKFMQKAEENRKRQNDEEIKRLRKEIDDDPVTEESEVDEGVGRRVYGPKQVQSDRNAKDGAISTKGEFQEGQESEDEYGRPQISRIKHATTTGKSQERQIQPTPPSMSAKNPGRQKLKYSNPPPENKEENPWLSTKPTKPSKSDRKRSSAAEEKVLITNGPVPTEPSHSSTLGPKSILKEPSSPPLRLLDEDSFEGFSSDSEPTDLPTNQDLIRRAFAGDDVLSTFAAEKAATIASEAPRTLSTALPGWGSWTGAGISAKAEKRNRAAQHRFDKSTLTTIPGIEVEKRMDRKLDKVIVNEKRVKKNAKYLAGALPHPFETRAQYERSLRVPVGPEWTTKEVFQRGTKPRVLLKQGVIGAMERPLV